MRAIPIFRGSHLAPYLDVLDEVGVPVEQRLSRAGLPCRDTVRSGSYLPLQRTVEFLDACAREEGIDELALRGALGSTEASLVPEFSRTLRAATTLRAAMRTVCSLAALEASCVGWRMETGAATVRICTRLKVPLPGPVRRYQEWYANMALVKVVRSFAGSRWCPADLLFESAETVGDLACEQFPATRLRTGAPCTGIEFPVTMLTLSRGSPGRLSPASLGGPVPVAHEIDFVESLKLLLEAYSPDHPGVSVHFAAELAGTSVRTLQRRLSAAGLSYSDLLQRVRFDLATRLLRRADRKVIDVAFELGWSDPSHFARAFRRIAGMSPRQFRAQPGL